jgi:hypothetical protein
LQESINHPAPPDMNLVRVAAVVQGVGIVAASVLKGVGQNRHSIKGTLFVNTVGKSEGIGREPRGVNGDKTEGVAENVSDSIALVARSPLLPVHLCINVSDTVLIAG